MFFLRDTTAAETSTSRFTERNRTKIIEIGVVTNCVRNNFRKKSACYSRRKTFVEQ